MRRWRGGVYAGCGIGGELIGSFLMVARVGDGETAFYFTLCNVATLVVVSSRVYCSL